MSLPEHIDANNSSGDEDDAPLLVDATAQTQSSQVLDEDAPKIRVPITIVTGYLGAGKTTLMNSVLSEQHGKKIAVILNEFGDSADIEKSLTVNKNGEEVQEWLEVGNGCICCSVKDQGVNAIESLMERSGTFDYILLETTGLADPGNLAPLFWVDEGLGSTIYLDGIVTLVDAKNILKCLDEPTPEQTAAEDDHGPLMTTAHLQISHADVIVISKADLVSAEEFHGVEERIRSINGLARVVIAEHGKVPKLEGLLLDLHSYDDVEGLDIASKGHSHLDPTISTSTFTIPSLAASLVPKLDAWLRSILWDKTVPGASVTTDFEIHRLKARVVLEDGSIKMVQGVREVFDMTDYAAKPKGDVKPSDGGKIVVIGRGISDIDFYPSFIDTIVKSE